MKKTACLLLMAVSWALGPAGLANDQLRDWTLASGTKEQGEILKFDEKSRLVTIRLADGSIIKHNEAELSTIDRAWILQWVEQDEEARELLKKIGGTVTEYSATGKGVKVDYAVYQPVAAAPAEGQPMLILFHPGGNGRREIYRYIEAASAVGMTLVSMDHFKNGPSQTELFAEILPQIEATVPHGPTRMFMGGISGGAQTAYSHAAEIKRPWAGIFANGGWLGGKEYYGLPYPPMRVAMINGDKDDAANAYVEDDSKVLQKAGCVVSVHAFEGGHQLAPPSVQIKAMRWMLEAVSPANQIP